MIEPPADRPTHKGMLRPGARNQPRGGSLYPLVLFFAWDERIAEYIERNGGVHLPAIEQASRWTPGRVRSAVSQGCKAKHPVFVKTRVLPFPFGKSAQAYKLTPYGLALAKALQDRGLNPDTTSGILEMVTIDWENI